MTKKERVSKLRPLTPLSMAMENNNDDLSHEQVINYRGVKAMPFIIGNETFEKLGTIGTSANMSVYLTTVFHMKSATAATLLNVWNGTTNMAPLLGAFLSDSYLGRYKTIGYASISSLLGMTMMMLTAAVLAMHPPSCHQPDNATSPPAQCVGPSSRQLFFLFSAFFFLVIGAGGIRPCNLAFGADQFDPKTESGKRGINSFFNWYYFTLAFSITVALTAIVYIQTKISWAIGLGIPAFLMFLSCVLFILGSRLYVKVRPNGSPLTGVAQVLVSTVKKRRLDMPKDEGVGVCEYIPVESINSKLPRTSQFRVLDKAAIITTEDQLKPDGSPQNPWSLCSTQQVEEVKCILRVIPIWASTIIYFVALSQQHTYVVFQAIQSDRHLSKNIKFEVPGASYGVFALLTLTIWIPIYDRILIPILRKITKNKNGITVIQRMGIGILLSVPAMVVSGIVERKRKHIALMSGTKTSPLSAFWLLPQLALLGISEGFNTIGQIEFYYKEFPENMRSIAGSFVFCGIACSSYLSGFLVWAVHRISSKAGEDGDWLPDDLNFGKLDYFYYLIAGLVVLNFGYFLCVAKWYRYKGDCEMELEVGLGGRQLEKHIV